METMSSAGVSIEYDDPYSGSPFFSDQSLSAKIEKSPTLILHREEKEEPIYPEFRALEVEEADEKKPDELPPEPETKSKDDEPGEDTCYENVSKSNGAEPIGGVDCPSPSEGDLDGAIYDAPWDLGALQKGLEEKFKMNEEQRSRDNSISTKADSPVPVVTEVQNHGRIAAEASEGFSRRGSGKQGSLKGKPDSTEGHHGSILQRRPLPAFPPGVQAVPSPTTFKSQNFPSGSLVSNDRQPFQNPFHRKGVPVMGGGSVGRGHQHKPSMADWRPLEDYDAPWDNRQKDLMSTFSQDPMGSSSSIHGTAVSTATGPKVVPKGVLGQPFVHSSLAEKIESRLPLEHEWWYHGPITRHDAERRLKSEREGSYLIRNSESNRLDYSLSIKSSTGCIHLKIVPNNEGRFILGQFSQPFPSVAQMIQHYTVNKLPIKGAEHMSLTFPVGH